MASIQFFGASGTVTGSCYQFIQDGFRLMVDCGMFQGTSELEAQNFEPFGFAPTEVNDVVLTHAHLDHCGRLPKLVKEGFIGRIFCTQATAELAEIVLMDAAKISLHDRPNDPIYTLDDVQKTLSMLRIVRYEQPISLSGMEFVLYDAGHILGSCTLRIVTSDQESVIFSGDLGNSPQDLIKPTQIPPQAMTIIMESTYGDRLHPHQEAADQIARNVAEIEASGGTLLMPAFSIERTQEILHIFHHLKEESRIDNTTPVFMDGPMADRVTKVFIHHDDLFSEELLRHQAYYSDPFDFEGLVITRSKKDRRRIDSYHGPKVILAGSGMMMGGRILAHAKNYLPIASTRLLFTGFQAPDTLGREILDGHETIEIEGENIVVRANIDQLTGLSSHADQKQLLTWLRQVKPQKKVILTHGEDASRVALGQKIQDFNICNEVVLPQLWDTVEL